MDKISLERKCILVQGNFDVLHPGHIRLLKFAKECGDWLIVAINSDATMSVKSRVNENYRLELVKSLECVDDAFLTTYSASELIEKHKPHAVVKGKEFEERYNPELTALNSYGGKLIFGSGEFEANAEQFVKRVEYLKNNFDYSESQAYAQRHNIDLVSMNKCLDDVKHVRATVIGEIIVDEYVQGTAVGLSQEDPTIVMTPNRTDTFLGGAAITAAHIKSIGAKAVNLISVLGNDEAATFAKEKVKNYQVTPYFYLDDSRPTPLKTRYRAGSKTLLRVNEVRHHKIAKDIQDAIFEQVEALLPNTDLLVFSDFNYGVLPTSLVQRLTTLCKQYDVKLVADSQTSSQVGDISRYFDMDLITPTEKEVRVALNNPDDGLVILAQKLTEKSHSKNLVITLAEEGVLIHKPSRDLKNWENDRLPAINKHAIDPAGAGDCFLAASSLALAANASPWHAYYLGSLASACQVSTTGNTPLSLSLLKQTVEESFR